MANASMSGHALFSLRAAPRIGTSWVKDKVPPPRSRFSPIAARCEDSLTSLPPAPDAKQMHPSDIAETFDGRSEKPTDESSLTNSRGSGIDTTITRAMSGKPPFSPPPVPPPFPSSTPRKPPSSSNLQDRCSCSGSFISDHILNKWDQIFLEGANADITVCTDDGSRIYAHSAVLMASSPVLKFSLQKELRKSRRPVLRMLGVPFHAVRCFLRYLYSSRCERSDMDECALHLVVLAHTYMVPALKRLCASHFEQGLLNIDTVVDILQIARLCDAPRLYLMCLRRIIKDFKAVVRSDGWRAMKHSDPALEQEVIEAVIRASMRKQDKLSKLEDDRVYAQLYDAMEALTHLCRDGCRSIGSPDKTLTRRPTVCSYPACKRLESLVRHFADCKLKVAGGCVHCKRMWQLLELHSRMCPTGDSCKVPLCRHFKDAVGQQSNQKGELRWKMLVQRVKLAKRAVDALR